MQHTNESLTREGKGSDLMRAFRFAGKFLLVLTGVIATLLLFRISFAYSRWAGFLLLAVLTMGLYMTAPRWVRWLPGLLVFGIINSLLGLMTHHVPTNPRVALSAGVAGLLLAFYTVGCIVSYHYDAAHLSAIDRCALLLYLCCLIWPAIAASKNLSAVTPVIAWSISIGIVALVVSFAAHRTRRGKGFLGG